MHWLRHQRACSAAWWCIGGRSYTHRQRPPCSAPPAVPCMTPCAHSRRHSGGRDPQLIVGPGTMRRPLSFYVLGRSCAPVRHRACLDAADSLRHPGTHHGAPHQPAAQHYTALYMLCDRFKRQSRRVAPRKRGRGACSGAECAPRSAAHDPSTSCSTASSNFRVGTCTSACRRPQPASPRLSDTPHMLAGSGTVPNAVPPNCTISACTHAGHV